jgi:hypothetical protein
MAEDSATVTLCSPSVMTMTGDCGTRRSGKGRREEGMKEGNPTDLAQRVNLFEFGRSGECFRVASILLDCLGVGAAGERRGNVGSGGGSQSVGNVSTREGETKEVRAHLHNRGSTPRAATRYAERASLRACAPGEQRNISSPVLRARASLALQVMTFPSQYV